MTWWEWVIYAGVLPAVVGAVVGFVGSGGIGTWLEWRRLQREIKASDEAWARYCREDDERFNRETEMMFDAIRSRKSTSPP